MGSEKDFLETRQSFQIVEAVEIVEISREPKNVEKNNQSPTILRRL